MKKTIIAAVMAGCASCAGAGEFMDGNKLLEHLESKDNAFYGLAIGFLMGVHDADDGDKICSPGKIQAGQIADMVRTDLRRYANIRHLPAALLVRATLSTAWPCAKKNNGRTM